MPALDVIAHLVPGGGDRALGSSQLHPPAAATGGEYAVEPSAVAANPPDRQQRPPNGPGRMRKVLSGPAPIVI